MNNTEHLITDYKLKLNRLLMKINSQSSSDVKVVYLKEISRLSMKVAREIENIDQKQLELGDEQLQINFNNMEFRR